MWLFGSREMLRGVLYAACIAHMIEASYAGWIARYVCNRDLHPFEKETNTFDKRDPRSYLKIETYFSTRNLHDCWVCTQKRPTSIRKRDQHFWQKRPTIIFENRDVLFYKKPTWLLGIYTKEICGSILSKETYICGFHHLNDSKGGRIDYRDLHTWR